jgi:hypothetical protein
LGGEAVLISVLLYASDPAGTYLSLCFCRLFLWQPATATKNKQDYHVIIDIDVIDVIMCFQSFSWSLQQQKEQTSLRMLSCVFVDFFYCNLQRQKNKRDY